MGVTNIRSLDKAFGAASKLLLLISGHQTGKKRQVNKGCVMPSMHQIFSFSVVKTP